MCFLVLLNHKQSQSCNFSWDRKRSNKLAHVWLQKIHSATNLFCHCFVLLSGRPQGNKWTQGWLVCGSGLSVGWGELYLQLRCAKSFSLWRELGCTVCTCLRKKLTCLRHLCMDLGNDQIWKGNLIYQQVSQNLIYQQVSPQQSPVHPRKSMETPELLFDPLHSCGCISCPFPLTFPCNPWVRLCLLQQQRKCHHRAPCAGAAGGCNSRSHGWGMSGALCAIIVLCSKLEQPREGLTACPSGIIPRDLSEPSALQGVHQSQEQQFFCGKIKTEPSTWI